MSIFLLFISAEVLFDVAFSLWVSVSTAINTSKVIKKLKQPMITIKVITKNRACCGFQEGLQTKNGDMPRTEHTHYQ